MVTIKPTKPQKARGQNFSQMRTIAFQMPSRSVDADALGKNTTWNTVVAYAAIPMLAIA